MDAEEIAGLLDEFADWLQYAETTAEIEDDDYRVDLGQFGEQSMYVSGSTSVDLESEVQALAPSGVDSPADFRSLAEAVRALAAAPVFSRAETREYDPLTVPIERDSEYVGWKDLRLGDFVTSIGRVIKIDPATGAHTVARRNDANDGGVKLPVVTEDYGVDFGRSSWNVRRAIGGVQAFRSTAPFDPRTVPVAGIETATRSTYGEARPGDLIAFTRDAYSPTDIRAWSAGSDAYRVLRVPTCNAGDTVEADARTGDVKVGFSDSYLSGDRGYAVYIRRALVPAADGRRQVLPEPTAVA